MTSSILNILQCWEQENVERLVNELNSNAFVSDEGGLDVSSRMVEYWDVSCDAFLREKGYEGKALHSTAKFVDDSGAIYVLYDSARITYEQAKCLPEIVVTYS